MADRWKSAVWLGKNDLTDEHLVRTDEGVVYARSVRRLAEHSWSEENLRAVVETPQRPKTTIADIPPAAEHLALPHEPQEAPEDKKKEPTAEQEEDDEVQGEEVDTKETSGTSSSGRGEKRTETQENVSVKKRLVMKSPKRRATPVSPPDDPVKRRLLKKTDLQSNDVLMEVDIKDMDLLHTVNTLLNDNTGEEEKLWSEEVQRMKILTVLDDHEEMMKGRHKELNSLKEMGAMTVVTRSEAAGKRVIQTRWVDRQKDGRVKSRLVLKDYNRCQVRTQPEMFSPTPSTLSLKTMLAASSYDGNNHPEREHITIAIDVHTAFLHADVDQELFAEPPEPDEWYDAALRDDELWKLNKALYGYRRAPKLWHQHVVSVLESLNYRPLLTDPSRFKNDELNINIFIHVDDGLLFGPRSEVLRSFELLSKQVLMRIVEPMGKLGDKISFLGRVIERTARGYLVEANPKYIRDVIAVLGQEDSRPMSTPSVKRTPWRMRGEPCAEQPWESCCTFARSVLTSRTA